MCKEMPVILVNRVVDKKRIIGKLEGQGGVEAQGVADPKNMFLPNLVDNRRHYVVIATMASDSVTRQFVKNAPNFVDISPKMEP
jgi:hypothetical protein